MFSQHYAKTTDVWIRIFLHCFRKHLHTLWMPENFINDATYVDFKTRFYRQCFDFMLYQQRSGLLSGILASTDNVILALRVSGMVMMSLVIAFVGWIVLVLMG